MKRPRILYITYGNMFRMTGYSEQCRAEVTELARRGYKVLALAFENHAECRAQKKGRRALAKLYRDAGARLLPVPIFGESRPGFRPVRDGLDGATLATVATAFRADILHAHEVRIAAVATHIGKLLRIPVVTDMHGLPLDEGVYGGAMKPGDPTYAMLEMAERRAIEQANLVFAVSRPFVQILAERYRIDPDRMLVTRSSVDVHRFQFDAAARRARRADIGAGEGPVVLFVGSIHRYQIFDQVVRFFIQVRNQRPDARLLVLTNSVESIVGELARLGVSDGVVVRSVPHGDVPQWMSAADVGVLLRERSPVNRVASPVKLAEYLACGLPVAISDEIGDLSDLVREHELGVVLDRLEDSAYTAAAKTLLDDWPANAADMRRRCRRVAEDELSWELCMAQFERGYRKLAPRRFD